MKKLITLALLLILTGCTQYTNCVNGSCRTWSIAYITDNGIFLQDPRCTPNVWCSYTASGPMPYTDPAVHAYVQEPQVLYVQPY